MIKLNEKVKGFVARDLTKHAEKHSLPIEMVENLYNGFVMMDEINDQMRMYMEKSSHDIIDIMKKMDDIRRDVMATAMAAKICNSMAEGIMSETMSGEDWRRELEKEYAEKE